MNAAFRGRPTRRRVIAAHLCWLPLAGAAFGQPAPYTQPQSVRPNLPGSAAEEIGLPVNPPLAREGSFVSAARGQAIKSKSGRWFFVFDPDSSGRTLAPMVILPGINLAAVERAAERNPEGTRLLVTGQVTAYHNLNYLMLTAPPLLVRADAAPPTPADVPAAGTPPPPPPAAPPPTGDAAARASTPPSASPAAPAGGEPSIDEIVAKLDKAAGQVGSTAPVRPIPAAMPNGSGTGGESSSGGTARNLLPAGLIASRRGRVLRAADGAMVFTFDSGAGDGPASGPSPGHAPLVLLPCQNLAAIEQLSERTGEGATYTVTGEVTTYRGRNYLLLRSYQLNRATDQVMPAQ